MSCRKQGDQTAVLQAETMNSGAILNLEQSLFNQPTIYEELFNFSFPPRKRFASQIVVNNFNLTAAFGFLNQRHSSPEFDSVWKMLLRPQTPVEIITEAAKQANSLEISKRAITILLARTLRLHNEDHARDALEKLAVDEEAGEDLQQRAKLALFALAYDQDHSIAVPEDLFPKLNPKSNKLTWFLDVDGTLYSKENPLLNAIVEKISVYAGQKMGLSKEDSKKFADEQYYKYGSTISGMLIDHPEESGNPFEFMENAHDVPMKISAAEKEAAIKAKAVPGRKFIVTNAYTPHAKRVWEGVANEPLPYKVACDGVDMLPYCKPHPYAFLVSLHNAGVNPKECVMVDDSRANTAAAIKLGMKSVLVGCSEPVPPEIASCAIKTIGDLDQAATQL